VSVRGFVGRLTGAKCNLDSAQRASATTAAQIGQAEESIKHALDGASAGAMVARR
jgi:hypothetical protein